MSHVRDFGAVGDGRTDDTDALAHAITRAADGVLEFGRGDYRITRTLEAKLDASGRFALLGRGTARLVMAGAGPALRLTGTHAGSADPKTVTPVTRDRERSPLVEGIEIVGDHEQADGIELLRTFAPVLRGLLLRDLRDGVRLIERNRNLLLEGSHIYNCRGVGVLFDKVNIHQAIVNDCHISYCKGGGIKVVGGEIRNIQIVGNDIEYNYDLQAPQSGDVWFDISEGSLREGTIVGNTIQAKVSPGGANIRLIGPATDPNKLGLLAIGSNHVSNQEVNLLAVRVRGLAISGNTFCLGTKHTIRLEDARRVTVADCVLDRNPDYKDTGAGGVSVLRGEGCSLSNLTVDGSIAGSPEAGGAIELVDCVATHVSNCRVLDPKFRGIAVSGGRDNRINGCLVLDHAGQGTLAAGIEVFAKSPGTVISHNTVAKGTKGEVVCAAGLATVEGNSSAS